MTQPNDQPRSQRNKRLSRRQAPKGSTKAVAYPNWLGLGANIALAVLDVSETGIRLLVRELPRNGEFEINLESIAHRPVKTLAQVVWSCPTADGNFVLGARFDKSLPYAALQALARS